VAAGTRHGYAKRCCAEVSRESKGFGGNWDSKFEKEFFHGKQ
jgi:hypothetical protein